jgi:hypothetical protein
MNTRIRHAHTHGFHGSLASLADLVRDLKKAVGQQLAREFSRELPVPLIHRAIEEAVESAWATDFPHLFLPALAEERVRLVHAAVRPDSHDGGRTFRRAA